MLLLYWVHVGPLLGLYGVAAMLGHVGPMLYVEPMSDLYLTASPILRPLQTN